MYFHKVNHSSAIVEVQVSYTTFISSGLSLEEASYQ
jgi:hypothetical protein